VTWEYRECEVILESKLDRQLMHWLAEGWELVGLHRKQRRKRSVVMAIMRRPNKLPARLGPAAAAVG
jgi:hypothetical protein